ncbi:hypothetical protein [Pectobacterium polaris]|uniref:Uncharacterized protein n=1 Tax=Pectobacterium polaris TaxID=2042057 RepID=A0AAW5GEJ7_9GAMM|nr:hypothetical protein [Pectobacterium polaris]MCL6351628.1 hypothetical protein [Pectobacterium polaris]MCL6369026.1 hypothetical protein [Pectobacterium polaris]
MPTVIFFKKMHFIFSTQSRLIRWLGFLSILTLVVKIFVFNNIREIFPNAYELGLVFESILSSIFASYIFHLIVVHGRELKEKNNVYPGLLKIAMKIMKNVSSIIEDMAKFKGLNVSISSKEDEISDLIRSVNILDLSRLIATPMKDILIFEDGTNNIKYHTWLFYILDKGQGIKDELDNLIRLNKISDPELQSEILDILDSSFFKNIDLLNKIRGMDRIDEMFLSNISFDANFIDFSKKINNLVSYLKRNIFSEV